MAPNSPANDAFERLKKILALEKRQGYRNKAVIGGLDKFAARWEQDARHEMPDRATVITAIVTKLTSYPTTPDQDARARLVNDILSRLSMPPAMAAPRPAQEPPPAPRPVHDTTPAPRPARDTTPAPRPARDTAAAPRPASKPAPDKRKPAKRPEAPSPKATPAEVAPEPPPRDRRVAHRKAKPLSAAEIDLGLQAPVTTLPSIGPHYAAMLERLGIHTVEDMLWLFPRRYVDYSNLQPISSLRRGEDVTVLATVWEAGERRLRSGQKAAVAVVADATGTLQAIWYNPYVLKQLKADRLIALSGRVDLYMGRFVLNNPEWEPLDKELVHTGRLVPIYPLTKDLSQRWLRQRIKQAVDAWATRVVDFLPDRVISSARLMSLPRALQAIHFPENPEQLEQARRRMAFSDMLLLQLGMQRQRHQWRSQDALPLAVTPDQVQTFLAALPFTLTGAQQAALEDVLRDMQQTQPMSRLLQGDVGSGKTAVAAAAMWVAVTAGRQAALMAPTEILAEQHFQSLSRLFAPWLDDASGADAAPLRLALLTGSLKEGAKVEIRQQLAAGEIDLVVGTHALIQEDVQFARLGLAIVDEQHRFGVEQRAALKQRRADASDTSAPHLLVMSATPIPRSLALTMYGDLDVSVIGELPPGRQSIQTYVIHPLARERAYNYVERQVETGRQAYVVCPLVEESEQSDARAAVAEYERLQSSVFPQFKLGLLHGRMKSDEKEVVMQQFAANEIQILVSTSVIEVGIDVPNATVMLVEGANHFGLAQLHQFRGRVGRGEHASTCLLLVERAEQTEDERLRALAEIQDGFQLAEIDLQMRGPGDFLGTRQSGLPAIALAGFADLKLLEKTRQEAQRLLEADPTLSLPENQALAAKLETFWRGAGDVS